MKIRILYVVMAAFIAVTTFTACNSNKKNSNKEDQTTTMADRTHNSRNSLDYEGTYAGTMPCADCSGIYTEITLSGDNFKKKTVYQGKEDGQNTFEESGKYAWNNDGSIITLDGDKSEQYQVGENKLFALDMNGKRITGDLADMYILKKN